MYLLCIYYEVIIIIKWWKPLWIHTWEFYIGFKKIRIPAYPLEKQLSHFDCLGQLLACLIYIFCWRTTCLDPYPLGK